MVPAIAIAVIDSADFRVLLAFLSVAVKLMEGPNTSETCAPHDKVCSSTASETVSIRCPVCGRSLQSVVIPAFATLPFICNHCRSQLEVVPYDKYR